MIFITKLFDFFLLHNVNTHILHKNVNQFHFFLFEQIGLYKKIDFVIIKIFD